MFVLQDVGSLRNVPEPLEATGIGFDCLFPSLPWSRMVVGSPIGSEGR